MASKKIYDNEKEVLRKRNLELNTMISELEDKNTQLLLEDQRYIKLTNQVLDNVHLEYVWRAVKQVLRDTNVDDFKDNDYKKLMERACRILTEDKRGILKQAWNNFLRFFNENNEIGAKIVNIENCVLEYTVDVNNGENQTLSNIQINNWRKIYNRNTLSNEALDKIRQNNFMGYNEMEHPFRKQGEPYKKLYEYFTAEKKRKSISNKLRKTRNKTITYLKKKRNQTRNFFKKKRQNITQKVGNLRKRLFDKKTLSKIQKNNFIPPQSGRFPVTKPIVPGSEIKFNNYVNSSNSNESDNFSRQIGNHKKKFPLLYNSNNKGVYI